MCQARSLASSLICVEGKRSIVTCQGLEAQEMGFQLESWPFHIVARQEGKSCGRQELWSTNDGFLSRKKDEKIGSKLKL